MLIAPRCLTLSYRVSLQLGGLHGEEELALRARHRDAPLLHPALRLAVLIEDRRDKGLRGGFRMLITTPERP